MQNKIKKSMTGFTIIEVIIVLAIAALILVIVFAAVPALQRNSHNNQYKSEATRILAGTSEYINNNNGVLPTTSGSGTSGSPAASIYTNSNAKLITTLTVTSPSTGVARTPTLSLAYLETGATCPTTVSGTSVTPVTAGAPASSLVLVYGIEKAGGGVAAQCLDS